MKACLFAVLALMFTGSCLADVALVEDGEPVAEIVIAEDAVQGVKLAAEDLQRHLELISGTKLELLMGTDEESVISKFIEKKGEGIHHICFEVEDVEKAAAQLHDKGIELVDKPRMGAEGKKIVFIKPKNTHGVLIELVER